MLMLMMLICDDGNFTKLTNIPKLLINSNKENIVLDFVAFDHFFFSFADKK